jgi:hypothetical protein
MTTASPDTAHATAVYVQALMQVTFSTTWEPLDAAGLTALDQALRASFAAHDTTGGAQ